MLRAEADAPGLGRETAALLHGETCRRESTETIPPAALGPGKHFDWISIVGHSRKTVRLGVRLAPI